MATKPDIKFHPLADGLSKQLARQGLFQCEPYPTLRDLNRTRKAANTLKLNGLLSEKEFDRIKTRILQKIELVVGPAVRCPRPARECMVGTTVSNDTHCECGAEFIPEPIKEQKEY